MNLLEDLVDVDGVRLLSLCLSLLLVSGWGSLLDDRLFGTFGSCHFSKNKFF